MRFTTLIITALLAGCQPLPPDADRVPRRYADLKNGVIQQTEREEAADRKLFKPRSRPRSVPGPRPRSDRL